MSAVELLSLMAEDSEFDDHFQPLRFVFVSLKGPHSSLGGEAGGGGVHVAFTHTLTYTPALVSLKSPGKWPLSESLLDA